VLSDRIIVLFMNILYEITYLLFGFMQ